MSYESTQLKLRQALPLDAKVMLTKRRIREWYEAHDGKVCISFSGGKDSTVLLHLVRSIYPDVPAVFVDTGLEFPEVRSFALSQENVFTVRPKMNFKQVIERYGWPVISKETSQKLYEIRTTKSVKLRNLRLGIEGRKRSAIPEKYRHLTLLDPDWLKFSHKCCDVLKKQPFRLIEKEFGAPYIGIMASDSGLRNQTAGKYGCNAFDAKHPSSRPMLFWTEGDVWSYIKENGLSYSSIYDMGYERTGCMFCMFGCQPGQSGHGKFAAMAKTHPELHSYCLDKLGARKVLEYFGWETGDKI